MDKKKLEQESQEKVSGGTVLFDGNDDNRLIIAEEALAKLGIVLADAQQNGITSKVAQQSNITPEVAKQLGIPISA